MPQSFELKLGRAMEHAETLDREIRRWIERNPALIVSEPIHDPKGRRREWRFRPGVDADPTWCLLIGDCIHNMRAALDHLAFALATAHSGTLSDKAASDCEFPIFGTRPMNAKEAQAKIGCIDPTAQRTIQRLQPHLASPYQDHPLWLIHELDNVDKHRLISALVVVSPGILVTGQLDLTHADLTVSGGVATKQEAPVATMHFDEAADFEREVGFQPIVDVAFSEGPARGRPVRDTVRRLHAYVAQDVIAPLARFL